MSFRGMSVWACVCACARVCVCVCIRQDISDRLRVINNLGASAQQQASRHGSPPLPADQTMPCPHPVDPTVPW